MKGSHVHRSGKLIVALVAWPLLSHAATAACVPEAEPNDDIATATRLDGEICITGAVQDTDQDAWLWRVADADSTRLWSFRLEALPGQTANLKLYRIETDTAGTFTALQTLYDQSSVGPTADVATGPLMLRAGIYGVLASSPRGRMVYRLTAEAGETFTSEPGTRQTNAFHRTLAGGPAEIALPWSLTGDGALNRWTISLQTPLGVGGTLTLKSTDGAAVATARTPDAAGVVRLADLGVSPGDYTIAIAGLPESVPLRLVAEAAPKDSGSEEEPNDEVARAIEIRPGDTLTGRLIPTGGPRDEDLFALTLDERWRDRRLDVIVRGSWNAALTLDLVDESKTVLQTRTGTGETRVRGITLDAGRHLIRVSGALPPDARYSLAVTDAGPAPVQTEREPNDVRQMATAVDDDGTMTGRFSASDRDYLDLAVNGALQLWDVEVVGRGLSRASVHDGVDAELAAGTPAGTSVIRLSRLLLPPGRNAVRLDGTDTTWTLRARPLGPPRADEEIEPNDTAPYAVPLAPGTPHTGWLDRAGDIDLYTFHLNAHQRVTLELQAPAALPIEMSLGWGEQVHRLAQLTTVAEAGGPQMAIWDGLLEAGDYVVSLTSVGGVAARDPYRLSLELGASYFDRPADLEPNDAAWQAAELPHGARLAGRLNGRDVDWYRLPATMSDGTLQVTGRRIPSGAATVTVARAGAFGPEPIGSSVIYAVDRAASFELPGGAPLLMSIGSSDGGEYELELAHPGLPAPPAPSPITARLELEAEPLAAFVPDAQRVAGTLRVTSRGAAAALEVDAWAGDRRWRLDLPSRIEVPAQGEIAVPVVIEVAPNAEASPVSIEIALGREGFARTFARATVAAEIGAQPRSPTPFEPLPPAMRGGLNVASAALGGSVDSTAVGLIDGVIETQGVSLLAAAPPVVSLAGAAPVPVAGVILHPPPGSAPTSRLADFAVEVSADGSAFARILEARASPEPREQPFVFASPVPARALRLVPLSSHGGPSAPMLLSELEVVATPEFALPGELDIASAALGGHVVRHDGFGPNIVVTGESAVWPGTRLELPGGRDAAPEWVIGFRNGRAARIGRFIWHESDGVPAERRIGEVEIATSVVGPFGPWESRGRWRLDVGNGSTAELRFDEPFWARVVRFRVLDAPAGPIVLPERIQVFEAPGVASVVREWGDADSAGPYEASLAPVPVPEAGGDPGRNAGTAAPLALDALARGRVQRGVREDWYRLALPEGTRGLRLRLAGDAPPEATFTLIDAAGNAIELAPDGDRADELVVSASPGEWLLRVSQPPQSVVVSWDTSISTTPFVPHVTRLIRRLVWELEPDGEQLNLLPFGSSLLMQTWSGQPGDVYAALHAYPWNNTSSDADGALLAALAGLEQRPGGRAIVLVTDAADTIAEGERLWNALARTRAKVFALHLPIVADPVAANAQANLMRDWAKFTGGFYTRFASQGDAEAMLRRIRAWLRQPASYAFTATVDTRAPEPGKLLVRRAASASTDPTAGAAVEIVLDASGSMLQRLGGVRRIDIARRALDSLAASGVPPGTALALRVFGQGDAGSCASDLVLPLAPLDPTAFGAAIAAIQPVDGARTPIGASLRLAGQDLADAAGAKLIVLLTDGEETCEGDPAAEIEALRAQGLDVRLNIVGFAVDDVELKETFARWAAAGGGAFFDAADAAALSAALERAVDVPFDVVAADGRVVATGAVGGESVELPPGAYTVRVAGARDGVPVTIESGRTRTVDVEEP